jgi:CheY-like chemotaxis protein
MTGPLPTILVVEDSPDDVFLLRRAFRKANLMNPVHVAEDGQVAIDYLSGAPPYQDRAAFPLPALVLLDLKLPRRSGHEVLEWIRAQPGGLRRVPVAVLTTSRESPDVNRAYDLGANSYLAKPVDFDALLELVKTLQLYWMILNERPDVRAG